MLKLKHLRNLATGIAIAAFATFAIGVADEAEESAAEKIARAMSAAPASISENARIIDVDGSLLREGNNGWTCIPVSALSLVTSIQCATMKSGCGGWRQPAPASHLKPTKSAIRIC